MTTEQAILHLRSQPENAELMRSAYLDGNVSAAAERFFSSDEFRETCRILGPRLKGAKVVDVGAGTGIASCALARAGAAKVFALEPDDSAHIGRGAIAHIADGLPICIVEGICEEIPLPDVSVDIVYARQVLHHTRDLKRALRECARVLKPGGIFLACREHVIKDEDELEIFLANHPVHKLAGGENAYSLEQYTGAIGAAGMELMKALGPLSSIINAFPDSPTSAALRDRIREPLRRRLGLIGVLASYVPMVQDFVRSELEKRLNYPGKLYSFVARKAVPSRWRLCAT